MCYFFYESFEIPCVSNPKYLKSVRCPEYCLLSGTDSGPMLEHDQEILINVCAGGLLCGHTLAAPPTCSCYLNELIKPPSNYLSYVERRIRRGQTIAAPEIIASRFSLRLILSFAPNLSSSRSLFISSPCILFFCVDNDFFRVFRKLAYLRMTIRLFENRKIRKSQEKLNGLVSANYEGELLSTRQRVYRGRSPPTISLILTDMIQRARVFY